MRAQTRLLKRLDRSLDLLSRYLSSGMRMTPSFLIVGAQKAGTTSLYRYLCQHPRVLPAFKKEIHYFDLRYDRGWKWYSKRFPLREDGRSPADPGTRITGEASPSYLLHPLVARRIRTDVPGARIIILLRSPTQRAISHFYDSVRKGRETRSLEVAITEEMAVLRHLRWQDLDPAVFESPELKQSSYLLRGLYLEQVRTYFDAFPAAQVRVVDSADLFARTRVTVNEVLDFLGLEALDDFDTRPRYVGDRTEVSARVVRTLDEYFRPRNEALFDYLGRRFAW